MELVLDSAASWLIRCNHSICEELRAAFELDGNRGGGGNIMSSSKATIAAGDPSDDGCANRLFGCCCCCVVVGCVDLNCGGCIEERDEDDEDRDDI